MKNSASFLVFILYNTSWLGSLLPFILTRAVNCRSVSIAHSWQISLMRNAACACLRLQDLKLEQSRPNCSCLPHRCVQFVCRYVCIFKLNIYNSIISVWHLEGRTTGILYRFKIWFISPFSVNLDLPSLIHRYLGLVHCYLVQQEWDTNIYNPHNISVIPWSSDNVLESW